jgi:hypothetical protein
MNLRYTATLVAAALIFASAGCGGDSGGGPGNHPPELEAQRDTSVVLGDTLNLWARAVDPDGHAIKFKLVVSLSFEDLQRGYFPEAHIKADGHFVFVPVPEDRPVRDFAFVAEDDFGGSDEVGFQVYISSR